MTIPSFGVSRERLGLGVEAAEAKLQAKAAGLQGSKRGSVATFWEVEGWPVRIAVPVGPWPVGASSQVMERVLR